MMRRTTAVMFAAVLAAAGCGHRPDTEEHLRLALDQADLHEVEVVVDEDARMVVLIGTVDTLAERTRAEEIAGAVVGTSGRVVNDLTVETLAAEAPDTPDEQLQRQLDALIDADRVLRERDVNIQVAGGAVTVVGEVRSAAEKERVTRILRKARGVASVSNELEIVRQP